MKKDLSTILPQEIWIDILGRLPIKSIMSCKFVCKSWGDLIEAGEIESSTSKSLLAIGNQDMGFAICDEVCQPLFQFGLPHSAFTYNIGRFLVDSANGLLLVWDRGHKHYLSLLICNPITSEYVELPLLPIGSSYLFGFGVSILSGQYKILSCDNLRPRHVYTLERGGLWRSIAAEETTARLSPPTHMPGAFFNGNLHWLTSDSERNHVVCCFDLETELSTRFSLPPGTYGYYRFFRLCVLDGLLCLCDSSWNLHVFIWTMNNYEDVSSWVKEYTFDQLPHIREIGRPDYPKMFLPLKILANGDLLFTIDDSNRLIIYSKNTRALVPHGFLQRSIKCYYYSNITNYTPSFLTLRSMGIDDVRSLSFR